jgi:selenocysteine lyase/cysteine desulfurase
MRDTGLRDDLGIRAFDVFCPANFLDVLPWTASLQLIVDAGADVIADWDQQLVSRLIAGLDPGRYRLVSPADGPSRSSLVVIDDTQGDSHARYQRLASLGIDAAYREGNLRLSLHLFNTEEQVDRTLGALQTR